jgi:hypothetical protein
MPEFKRLWKDWPVREPADAMPYQAAKTDESPSGSFVRPRAGDFQAENAGGGLSVCCSIQDCRYRGHTVELGSGVSTTLCAAHRRELFRRTREVALEGAESAVLEVRACRFCGEVVAPEDDPCRACAASASPLVELALILGAVPLCPCGEASAKAGGQCLNCEGRAK